MKRISMEEFQTKGYLQEVNRLFFHPLGLSLTITINKETGKKTLGPINDFRDEKGGVVFVSTSGSNFIRRVKAIQRIITKLSQVRQKFHGFIIQPLNISLFKK